MGSRRKRGGREARKVRRDDGFVVSKNRRLLGACKVVVPLLGTQYVTENKTASNYRCLGTIITEEGTWVIKTITDCGEHYEKNKKAAVTEGNQEGLQNNMLQRKSSSRDPGKNWTRMKRSLR